MLQKETEFDFSKESRKEIIKRDWQKFLKPTVFFTIKHKKLFLIGLAVFIVFKGIVYLFSDSPEELNTKRIAMQTASLSIPDMLKKFEKSKHNYDEIVLYLTTKEYDIQTNSMKTMQSHAEILNNYNVNFKKYINQKESTLEIIDKKIKETKTFKLLTSDEKDFLLKEYVILKSGDKYSSNDLDKMVNFYTTTEMDEKPTSEAKIKELENERESIKKEVMEIKKRNLK